MRMRMRMYIYTSFKMGTVSSEAEKHILMKDQAFLLAEVAQYQHLHKISQDIGWRKLWDHTLDHGLHVVKAYHKTSDNLPMTCNEISPLCDINVPDQDIYTRAFCGGAH